MVSSSPPFIGGCVAIFCVGTLAAAGGVGGGGLYLPLLLYVFDYVLNESVLLSLCAVLGNASWQFFLNIQQPSPLKPPGPLVSLVWWEVVIMLLPGLLGGSNLGSLLATLMPDSIRYVMALVLLFGCSVFIFDKGLKQRQRELELAQKGELIPVPATAEEAANVDELEMVELAAPAAEVLGAASAAKATSPPTSAKALLAGATDSLPSPPSLATFLTSGPFPAAFATACVWMINVVLSLRFTKMDVCTLDYRVSFGTAYIPIFGFTVWAVLYNRHSLQTRRAATTSAKDPVAAPQGPHDLDSIEDALFYRGCWFMPFLAFAIGIVTSLLGIGGGEILAPMLLHYHLPATVASGSATCMGFLNAFTIVIRALHNKTLSVPTGAVMYFLGAMSGFSGRIAGLVASQRYGKASFIVFLLSATLLFSCAYYVYVLSDNPFNSVFQERCAK